MSAATASERLFLAWLRENGASFDKIEWPVWTPTGLRGAIAKEDISPNEVMLSIPKKLLISEATCWADAQLQPFYEAHRDLFARDDPLLALFLTKELTKGPESFYHPYLAMLPSPTTIQNWTDEELMELQDIDLVEACERRNIDIQQYYDRIMTLLDNEYPNHYPRDEYTFESFRFMWQTIQARTFGRLLPWTALVPFADCLNHANVATKYVLDDDFNAFELFPSSDNAYTKGQEVFNSYGRRPNHQLLLDYGFALPDNEWDFVDVQLSKDERLFFLEYDVRLPLGRLRVHRNRPPNDLIPSCLMDEESEEEDNDDTRMDFLTTLQRVVARCLLSYPTTTERDEALLQAADGDRKKTAIVYRLSKKRILESLLDDVADKIGTFEEDETDSFVDEFDKVDLDSN